MSKYEWERGTITLPSKEYPQIRKAILEQAKRDEEKSFALALKAHEILKQRKPKSGTEAFRIFDQDYLGTIPKDCRTHGFLFTYDRDSNRWSFHKPKKKDMKINSRSLTFQGESFSIHFDKEKKTVRWDVMENNHAVESARREPLAMLFFRLLGRVEWTRNTGGFFEGNDEYNRDEGPGCNYVTERFGNAARPIVC